jgi:hypothetical protein
LEIELAKVRGAESSLRLEFDRQLAEEKRILSTKYDIEVNELRTTLGSKIESRGTLINELETLRKLDSERHDKEIGIWCAPIAGSSPTYWGWKKLFVVYFPSCFSTLALSHCLLILWLRLQELS